MKGFHLLFEADWFAEGPQGLAGLEANRAVPRNMRRVREHYSPLSRPISIQERACVICEALPQDLTSRRGHDKSRVTGISHKPDACH